MTPENPPRAGGQHCFTAGFHVNSIFQRTPRVRKNCPWSPLLLQETRITVFILQPWKPRWWEREALHPRPLKEQGRQPSSAHPRCVWEAPENIPFPNKPCKDGIAPAHSLPVLKVPLELPSQAHASSEQLPPSKRSLSFHQGKRPEAELQVLSSLGLFGFSSSHRFTTCRDVEILRVAN